MANYKISQLPAYDQPVAADDLLAAVDTSFGTTKKLTTAQLFNDAGLTGLTTADSIDFNAGADGGELSWNNQEKTLDLVTGSDNVTIQLGQEVTLYARNNSGATMSDGQVVMISGSQGNNPTISLAQADAVENARKTIGVVTQTIANNSNGFVTLIGKVRDLVLDNGTYTEGDVVYLSDTVAGGLTNIEPAISVEVGHVLATSSGGNANGVLEVQINNNAGTGGTVYSVSLAGGFGITASGSPVTSAGTIAVELDTATQATLQEVATNTASIAEKAPIASPTFTGDLTVGNIEIGESSSSTVVNLLDASNGSDARTSIGLGASDIVEFGAFVPPAGTKAEIDLLAQSSGGSAGELQVMSDNRKLVSFVSPSAYSYIGGLNSSSVIHVDATGTASENGQLLIDSYQSAGSLTPNGAALSINNRAVVAVGCGVYTLPQELELDTDFVDVVGLSNNTQGNSTAVKFSVRIEGNVNVTASDVYLNGLHIFGSLYCGTSANQVFVGCLGTSSSFSTKAGGGIIQGTFINCRGGSGSFAYNEEAAGVYIDCLGEDNSFGAPSGTASGAFTRCIAGSYSFGGAGVASGTFVDCTSNGVGGFGGIDVNFNVGTASGTFIRCQCSSGDAFGGFGGVASGIFRNCVAGSGLGGSFAPSGTVTGKFSHCIMESGTFPSVTGSGKMRMCLEEATMTEINQG